MIPELRTSPRLAISLSVAAVAALGITFTLGHQLEDPLKSETGAVVVLALWCLAGAGGAITAIVDAYIKPEGERLALITTIVAAVFAVLALLVVIGIVIGATGVVDEDVPADTRNLSAPDRSPLGGL